MRLLEISIYYSESAARLRGRMQELRDMERRKQTRNRPAGYGGELRSWRASGGKPGILRR